MPYAKQVTTLLLLMLFLQGSKCGKKKGDNLPTPLPPKWPDNCLTLDQLTQGKHKEGISFNPTFELGSDPDAVLDTKREKHFDYDSGYDSDSNAKPEANAKIDKLSELDKKEQQPSSDPVKNSTEFDFESIIQTLRAGADKNRNITSKLSGTIWERTLNNNNSSSSNSLSTPEDYVIQGLNIYRAAKKMCNLYGQGGSVFEKKAHEFVLYYASHLEEPETFWIHTIKEINKAVVVHLQVRLFNKEDHKESLDSINEKLRLAENYVGLDDPHYNITTKLTIKGKEFVLEDTKWPPLTEKQKQGYLNRKPEPWYARLSPFEQKFIDAYVGKLSDGNHYIPTQLRGILGCRNGYQKRILTYDKKGKPMVLARYYHSGSLASPIEWPDKGTDLAITKDNWEQMTNQEKDLEAISLNYNMNLLLLDQVREKKIVEDTKQVVGADRFMNISTNGIGTSFNVAYQFNKLKEEALAYYKDRYPDLAESSIKKPTNQSLFQQLKGFIKNGATKGDNVGIDKDKIKDQQDKNFFTRLARLEESAKTSSFVNNWKQSTSVTDNPNATMCADYITCKIYLHRKGYSLPIAFSCKSGKDRTGIMSFLVDANIIATELNEADSVPCEALSQSGHYGTISAANGGKPGNFGMKPVKGNETVHRHRKLLFPHSARFTKIPLDEELVDLDAVHVDEAYTK